MKTILSNKIIQISVICVVLLIIFVPTFSKGVFESKPFLLADAAGQEYVDEAFDRALIAFALARATNAVISVIQDSEVNIAPAGIGVTIAVGEVLDPINDMIERFSLVMLVSLVSLGVQKFLIEVVPWFSLKFVLAPALLFFLLGYWKENHWTRVTSALARRLLILALLLRFSVPAVAILNEQVYRLFLDHQYTEAMDGLEYGKQTLTEFSPLIDQKGNRPDQGFMAGLKETARQVQEATNLRQQIERLGDKLTSVVKDILAMIVVFLLNTVLLPICFLWVAYKLFGQITTGVTWSQPPITAMGPPDPVNVDPEVRTTSDAQTGDETD